MPRLHSDELPIDASLARRMVDRAFPEFSGRRLEPVSPSGSSNALFRLGDDMVVRLPRQPGGGATIDKEARWLPFVRSRLTVAAPEIVGIGEPALYYPERWAIHTWLDGTPPVVSAAASYRGATSALARDLARFVTELRALPVPADAGGDDSLTWYRGLPLSVLDDDFRQAVEECRACGVTIDFDAALRVWDRALEASSVKQSTYAWYHGDFLAENVLLDKDGRLAGVLDFGGLAIGDPTVDLVVAWEVLDAEGRQVFRRAMGLDDASWIASKGWALFLAMITFPYYGATMPRRCADRLTMARAAIGAD